MPSAFFFSCIFKTGLLLPSSSFKLPAAAASRLDIDLRGKEMLSQQQVPANGLEQGRKWGKAAGRGHKGDLDLQKVSNFFDILELVLAHSRTEREVKTRFFGMLISMQLLSP